MSGVLKLPFPIQDDENVLRLCRRHWWFLWPRTILWVLFAIVPVVVLSWVWDVAGILGDLGVFWWGIAVLWIVFWALRLLLNWYRYHHDIWVVTSQRIIDSHKNHPFDFRVSTADLVNVQDISVDKSGLTPTLLNYGSVVCETAGSGTSDFIIAGIPHPEDVQSLIDKERDRERSRLGGGGSVPGQP
jgi:hypothetical protein